MGVADRWRHGPADVARNRHSGTLARGSARDDTHGQFHPFRMWWRRGRAARLELTADVWGIGMRDAGDPRPGKGSETPEPVGTLGRLKVLYGTEIGLLWHWRPGRRALIGRALLSILVALVAFYLTAWLVPGLVSIDQFGGGLLAVLLISLLNLLVRPALLVLVASRSIAALVILTLLFQALVIWLLTPLVPGVTVEGGLIGALVVSLIMGAFNALAGAVVGLSDEGSYYSAMTRALASRRPDIIHTDEPGLVVLQLDGVSHDVLLHSIRAGRVPFISSLVRNGSHKLERWEALLPSTTPASQAGILHGNNDGIPNFRWWEKENGQLLVANHPEDATVIEKRISDGEGLLSPGGASISNIFTGDGDRAFLVMSTIKVKERGLGQSGAFAWFFVSPYNYLAMIAKYIAEVVKENIQSRRQARAGIEPRMHRGFPYPWVRAATNVALRSLGTSLVMQEMLRGTPVIYMDYTDYDEIAHHSGPERGESLDALDGVDRQVRTLVKASEDAPRPYRFVLLADHGQSLGATFLQRYGLTLQEVVRSLMGGEASVAAATAQIEDWGQLNTFLSEVGETKGVTGSIARTATRGSRTDGRVKLGPEEEVDSSPRSSKDGEASEAEAEPADLIVVAGGNLALIYFAAEPDRLSLERVDQLYPGLVEALANHPGVGVLVVRSAERGLICVGRDGINYLEEELVEGVDPLAVYGEHAPAAVRRLDEIEHVGDLAVISLYEPETGEIAAFEELIGAHGGLGGAQTRPFLLHPSDWELDLAPLIGAPMVYQQLRTWMERELGMHFGPTEGPTTDAASGVAPDVAPGDGASVE